MSKRQKITVLVFVILFVLIISMLAGFIILKNKSLRDLPKESTPSVKLTRELSHIDIPLNIKKEVLNSLLEKYINKTIHLEAKESKPIGISKKVFGKEIKLKKQLHYEYDVNLNRGQIELQVENNTLELLLPLEGYANIRVAKSKPIRSLIKVKAGIKSVININPNGQILSKSSPTIQIFQAEIPIKTGISFVDKNLGSISIKSKLTKILTPILEKVVKEADKKISKDSLWKYLDEYWSKLKQDCIIPVEIQEGLKIYIKAEPQEFYYSGIKSNNNNLILSLGTKTYITIASNKSQLSPVCNIPKQPLINQLNNPLNKLVLSLPLQIDYQSIQEILKQTLAKETDNTNEIVLKNNIKLKIQDIEVSEENNKFEIKTNVKTDLPSKFFDVDSELIFSGLPEFNNKTNTVSVKQFDFDIKSKNLFIKSAKPALYIFRDDFARSYMSFDLSEIINKNKAKLNESLKSIKITEGITAQININAWEINNISAHDGYFLVHALVNGQSTLSLDSIEVLK